MDKGLNEKVAQFDDLLSRVIEGTMIDVVGVPNSGRDAEVAYV